MAVPEVSNDIELDQQPTANGTVSNATKDSNASRGSSALWFVRIPKPVYDEGILQTRQAEFKAMVDKLRDYNERGASKGGKGKNAKRMKANRIRELKKYRQGFVDQIKEIMSNVQGTDLRSEAALDERIRQMEGQIASGSISLREEKMVVQNVSRLQALRGKLREFDSCQEQLQYAEGEAQKLKSVLAGMESEFSILKAERDAANGVVQDIQKKINDCSKELEEMDEEEKEMTKAKNDAYEALQKAREDKDASLRDYRENRRFALEIRDMVAAGQAEEAKGLAAAQVEEWVGKLTSDTHLRADYTKLWSEQRKYMVSELLPDSSLSAKQEAAAKAKAAAPSKQAKGKKEKEAAAPARPSTAEQAKPSGPYVPPHGKEGGAAADKKKEDAPRFVENPNAAAMKNKVPLPRQYLEQDEEFVPPVELLSKNESDNQAAVDEAQRRAKLREEQRAKAAEAEERKRKRAEAAEKKKVAAAVRVGLVCMAVVTKVVLRTCGSQRSVLWLCIFCVTFAGCLFIYVRQQRCVCE
ncbi:hypothetical protein DUNSADRAFT_12044 [Dunaliella salina]|uniref:Uncharacterized protein n=1 Tax=Dunaliella salina TaxID=3046 RepID=A0ABQ7GC15_DUNSA|nr:hypothetical protein DUNSADRAFT_12044 [Dunaliella salina]|eukprot:KAF5832142.1 hypothetical protein DUNSADRAFT_12044 [Dunaliella salina]